MVISVLNPKGGCGKSTLSTNLACALQQRDRAVLLVDSDPQGTIRDWQHMQTPESELPPVIGIDARRLVTDLQRLSAAYDTVVIDGMAKMMRTVGLAVKVADLILIPIQPSGADLWAVSGLVELIRTRQQILGGGPRAAFVVSRQIRGTTLAAEVEDVLAAYELPVLRSRLSQRVIYPEALSSGTWVGDLDPGSKAAAEIDALTNEIMAWPYGAIEHAPAGVAAEASV